MLLWFGDAIILRIFEKAVQAIGHSYSLGVAYPTSGEWLAGAGQLSQGAACLSNRIGQGAGRHEQR